MVITMNEEIKTTETIETPTEPTVETPVTNEPSKPTTPVAKEVDVQAQLQALMVENAKLKRATDKATSEASDYKKKWKASLTEVEQASLEKAEREAEREEQFKELLRENQINKAEKDYLRLGYTPEEASQMAIAEIDNDFEAKVKIMAEVDARKRKDYEAEWLKTRPSVNSGVGGETPNITKAQFDSMGYTERVQFKNKYPETYKQFTS